MIPYRPCPGYNDPLECPFLMNNYITFCDRHESHEYCPYEMTMARTEYFKRGGR